MKKLSILLIVVLIAACQGKKGSTEEALVQSTFNIQRDAFFKNMLAPGEAAAALQLTAAPFNADLINDPIYYAGYANDDINAAANLGIYLADLNYSVAYQQSANTKELFTAAQQLSKVVGIEQSVLFFLAKRYEENLSKNDSARAIISELFKKATMDLEGTDRERLVGIAMAAYQIENLHLALGIIDTYPEDMLPTDARTQILIPVYRMVLAQQKNVENIYAFLKAISDPMDPDKNPNLAYYATAFEELIDVYKRLDVNEKIRNNQGLELMKDSVVKELRSKVNVIRTKIVSH